MDSKIRGIQINFICNYILKTVFKSVDTTYILPNRNKVNSKNDRYVELCGITTETKP